VAAESSEADGEKVVVTTTRANDITYAFLGGGAAVLAIAAMVTLPGEQWRPTLVDSAWMTAGMAMLCWFGLLGVGGVWRLLSPGPAIHACPESLRLHPSLGPPEVTWREVESIDLFNPGSGPYLGATTRLRIRFKRRHWSTWLWIGGRDLALPLVGLGLTYKQGRAIVKTLRLWLRAADRNA